MIGGTSVGTGLDWSLLTASEDMIDFVASARAYMSRAFPLAALRSDSVADPVSPQTWAAIVEQGYLDVGLPESLDGLGTYADLVALTEELGAAIAPVPILSSLVAVHTLIRAGIDPAPALSSPSALAIPPVGDQNVALIDGIHTKTAVLVRGSTVELVTGAAVGIDASVDRSRAVADYQVETVIASAEHADGVDDLLAPARTLVAAELVGLGALAVRSGIEHAQRRIQFGRPIGAFQSIQHQLADAHVAVERARSLTRGAGAALTSGDSAAVDLSLMAKAAASEAAVQAAELLIQLLGAIGLTWEADSPLILRRTRQTSAFLGTPRSLYATVAQRGLAEAAR